MVDCHDLPRRDRDYVEGVPICVGAPIPGEANVETGIVIHSIFRLELGFHVECHDRNRLHFCLDLKNDLGEADFQFFFLHKALCKSFGKSLSAHILSTDTDMLYLSMYHCCYVGLGCEVDIHWRYGPGLSWVFRPDAERPWPNEEKWVCINRLLKDIESGFISKKFKEQIDLTELARDDPGGNSPSFGGGIDEEEKVSVMMPDFKRLRFKVLDVMTCMFAGGGCDYTLGYQGITYDKIMEGFLAHGGHIGDLVKFDPDVLHEITLQGDAYAKLVVVSYLMGRGRLSDFPVDIADSGGISEIRKRLSGLVPKNRFPDERGVYGMMSHLLYYLKMIRQIHNPRLVEPDPTAYGFAPRDPTKPLSRSNITMILE